MSTRDAVLRAIEAAYVASGDEQEWLDEIRRNLERLGLGDWMGYIIDGNALTSFVGAFPFDTEHVTRVTAAAPEPILRAGHAPAPPVEAARQKFGRVARKFGMTLATFETTFGMPVPPVLGVLGCDARGSGVFLGLVGHCELPPRTKRSLADLAAHLNAAHRLRRQIGEAREPDAICSPGGDMLHGAPTAVAMRSSLALAVKNLDRARLRRLDPDEAIASWNAMVEGRWTLVDRVESDGKRFVLAHRNPPRSSIGALRGAEARVATLAALGHSDKYIGYELGLSRSTVATHLRSALVKLRLRDRRELVAVHGPLTRYSVSR